MYSKNKNYILLVVLIAGLGIRLLSINYGLPYVVGPDETRQILDALSMGSRLSLIPQDFAYAALHKYLLLLVYGIYFIFGKIGGLFSDKFQFALKFISEPYSFYLLGRILSAILGTITIFIVYKIGEDFYNSKVGIISAIFTALNFHLVQLSYWVSPDILLVFFSTLAFFFIFKLIRHSDLASLSAASLSVGLAISSKFQGFMLIVPLALTLLLTFYRDRKLLKITLISIALIFFSSLIGNAQYLIKPNVALVKFREILQASQFGISSAPVFNHNIFDSSIWYFKELIRQDGLIGLIFCLGSIYALLKLKTKENFIFIVSLFTFFLFFSRSSLRYVYYGALFLPLFSLFAAKLINDMYINSNPRKLLVSFLTAIIILFSLTDVLYASFRRQHLDTREEARDWIEENIPKGTTIAIDWFELNVPLESDIPFMVRTARAINFYKVFVSEAIRNKFKDFVMRKRKYYNLIPVIYEKEKDFWPADMPADVVEKSDKFDFAKMLYRRFNFLDLDELQDEGAEYLIISSYSYSHFLLDNDPNKTELFNPYLKEDTLGNNRQAEQYYPITKESILFFLSKRARDFYLPLLSLREKRATLQKEFRPNRFNLGPVIKIYKLNRIKFN